jgi:hypothetical protein
MAVGTKAHHNHLAGSILKTLFAGHARGQVENVSLLKFNYLFALEAKQVVMLQPVTLIQLIDLAIPTQGQGSQ